MTKGVGARLATATAGAAAAVLLGGTVARADGPSAAVAPNPVASRQETAVYGSGFCGAAGCSPVTVTIAPYSVTQRTCGPVARTAAVDVQVGSDGRFGVSFTVLEGSGQYCVISTQTLAGGSASSATTGMTVAAADYAPGAVPSTLPPGAPTPHPPTPTPQASPTSSPRSPGSSPGASPPASPPGQASPGPVGAAPAASSQSRGGTPWWVWAIAAGVVALSAAGAVLLRRRSSGGGVPPTS